MIDKRSKYFVLVPFCLLAQAYQAQGLVKYEWTSSIKPFVKLLIDNDINIIQMPCTESSYKNNLIRDPRGLKKYDEEIANKVAQEIQQIINSNYKVIAILGIEQSPSCCVNYIYTNNGNEKRKGIFMQKLADKIKDYNIPIIGINRKYINKSLKELETLIKDIKG